MEEITQIFMIPLIFVVACVEDKEFFCVQASVFVVVACLTFLFFLKGIS